MSTYIILSNLTDEGAQTIKKNPGRIQEVNTEMKELGVKLISQYALLGPYDFLSLVEAADNETIARVAAELSSRGGVKVMTMAAIPINDFIKSFA